MSKLTKAKGNMYDWVTHCWNPIIGCPHQCTYCYVRRFREQPAKLKLDVPFPNLGSGKKIFVGHLTDLFAYGVEALWIEMIIKHCFDFDNEYIFQSKNPDRISENFRLPPRSLVGTTIETDDANLLSTLSNAPKPIHRAWALKRIKEGSTSGTFLTIEPIMEFDVEGLINLIQIANPNFINIGADSKGHNLPEPPAWKIKLLIAGIENLKIEIRKKSNLQRLFNTGEKK